MKTIKILTTGIIAFVFIFTMNIQGFAQEVKEVKIKAAIKCNSCKAKIEKNMAFEKGVKAVDADVTTKIATIEYKADKTNAENLLAAMKKLGYKNAEIVTGDNVNEKNNKSDVKKDHDPPQ